MTDKERLEEIGDLFEDISNDMMPPYVGITCDTVVDVKWVIKFAKEQAEQIDSMAHVIKIKNKEIRELSNFLKDRNISLKDLSPLITVMNHVQKLEKIKESHIEELGYVDEQLLEAQEEKQRYKQALEEIINKPISEQINKDVDEILDIAQKALNQSK